MCVFCGGTCGGAGDTLMPLLAAAAGIAILKVRAMRSAPRIKNAGKTDDKETLGESTSERSDQDS